MFERRRGWTDSTTDEVDVVACAIVFNASDLIQVLVEVVILSGIFEDDGNNGLTRVHRHTPFCQVVRHWLAEK